MVKFIDGPANGQTLMLDRVPFLLRVTQAKGKFDALNHLDDQARPDETLSLYLRTAYQGTCHISRRPRSLSGWTAIAEYTYAPVQPSQETMRDNQQWNQWCDTEGLKLVPKGMKVIKESEC